MNGVKVGRASLSRLRGDRRRLNRLLDGIERGRRFVRSEQAGRGEAAISGEAAGGRSISVFVNSTTTFIAPPPEGGI